MYVTRDENGNITGGYRWPNAQTEKDPVAEDSPEWLEFLSRLEGE